MQGYPSRYVVFDTESVEKRVRGLIRTKVLTLRLGSLLVVDGVFREREKPDWFDFRTTEEFHAIIKAIAYSPTPIYVFAHNIGFDVRMVDWFGAIADGLYTLMPPPCVPNHKRYTKALFIAECPPFIVRVWRPDGQQIILLDSFQWFNMSLEDVGAKLGEPKGVMPGKDAPVGEWAAYCRQDVKVLHVAMTRLWHYFQTHRIPNWEYTPSMLAMRVYKARYEQKRIIRTQHTELLTLDRLGYYGGLAEAFYRGRLKGPIYKLDINSLYPAVMAENVFPASVKSNGDYTEKNGIPSGFVAKDATAEVWLESEDYEWPLKAKDETIWVRGKVRTILCGPELQAAFDLGVVRRIGRWTRYNCENLFEDWVRYWYAARRLAAKSPKGVGETLCKRMLNCIIGKFGQQTGQWILAGKRYDDHEYGYVGYASMRDKTPRVKKIVAGYEYICLKEEEDPGSWVPISAWTASYGRVRMWELMDMIGWDNVYYVATDCVLTNGVGLGNLQLHDMISDDALGKFRIDATHDKVQIYGRNVVDLDEKVIRPGKKSKAVKKRGGVWAQEEWSGLVEDLQESNTHSVTIKTLLINWDLTCKRRQLTSHGWTRAWRVDNWDIPPEEQSRMPVECDGRRED